MRLERHYGDAHPVVQGKSFEQTIELGSVVGTVETEDPALAVRSAQPPDPDQMSFFDEHARRGRFGFLALHHLALGGPLRRVDFERDQEFHALLLNAETPPMRRGLGNYSAGLRAYADGGATTAAGFAGRTRRAP